MFFIISKIVGFITTPTNVAVALVVFGLALSSTRFCRAARRITTTGAVFLVACAFLPLSGVLVSSLENRFPVQRGDILPPAGIIVLGGATDENVEAARGQVTLTDAGERLITGAITGAEARKKKSASENASDRLLIAPCCLRSRGSGPWKPANFRKANTRGSDQ